jgi:hypothetical protein
MKRVIDGKVYDTEKSGLIHEWDNGLPAGDMNYCQEVLYRTKQGTYFLVGDGGAGTSYSRQIGNNLSGDDKWSVLSEQDALEWLQSHEADADTITTYFDLPEG